MITLSEGHSFEYMAASGALATDGKGYVWDRVLEASGKLDSTEFLAVTSSFTLPPRRGNLSWLSPWGCVRPILENGDVVGFVNAKGLTNPGLPWWVQYQYPRLDRSVVVSVYADDFHELAVMAMMLSYLDIAAVELNASCPNSGETFYADSRNVMGAARVIREHCPHPLIVKLSVTQDLETLALVLGPYAKALSINSVPWKVVFPGERSPLARLGGGGVSGKVAQPWTFKAVERLVENGSIPVIGPSVWSYEDIVRVRALGAQAISFGSVFLRYPHRVTDWVRRDRSERR